MDTTAMDPKPAVPGSGAPESAAAGELVPLRQAAGELELKPRELALAVELGQLRVVTKEPGVRRVPRAEIGRLQAGEGFPEALRARLRLVGTREGAEVLGVPQTRFLRLARAGCFEPARFYVNRYRAVVWLYPAAELERFTDREPGLLKGALPPGIRALLAAHPDWRPRSWRARRFSRLADAVDPWERAGAAAALLDPDDVAEVVTDPYERAYVLSLRPDVIEPAPGGSAAAHELALELCRADTEDEVLWYRLTLAMALDEAREERAAPRPASVPAAAGDGADEPAVRSGWGWFRWRSRTEA
ncbi:hypothetical protein G5C51_26930 [Streptomyces sp. A7024]|uniref:Uncharacterized protein n=1 Tax=Streptomyces coryli TaxID=1128680 RepID=A0A6G4U8A3_9ACTN|nr:DUF6397 family protein [Streptomyces coryli]NGN67527.1 hypothetical protein [Streptomyces coryli]